MNKKDRNKSILATLIFHLVLVLILIFFSFKTPLPLPEEMGVVIEFGGGGGGGGTTGSFTQTSSEAVSHKEDNIVSPNTNTEPVATQDVEQTHVMSPQTQTQPVVKEEPVVDNRISNFWDSKKESNSKGQGSGKGSGQGSGNGSGSGSGNGTGSGNGSGTGGGDGNGPNFNLHGRSARYIPIPEYTEQEQGRVVVDIWVDKNGKVTKAIAGAKGTTTSNPALWRKAQMAALNSSFSIDVNAPHEQKGTITYNFIRLGN
jgi:outer membrane biosynthesis protein TonB